MMYWQYFQWAVLGMSAVIIVGLIVWDVRTAEDTIFEMGT